MNEQERQAEIRRCTVLTVVLTAIGICILVAQGDPLAGGMTADRGAMAGTGQGARAGIAHRARAVARPAHAGRPVPVPASVRVARDIKLPPNIVRPAPDR